jgi:hypothetical protein
MEENIFTKLPTLKVDGLIKYTLNLQVTLFFSYPSNPTNYKVREAERYVLNLTQRVKFSLLIK